MRDPKAIKGRSGNVVPFTARVLVNEQTGIRHAMLANGYVPLANKEKMTLLPGWTSLQVDAAMIDSWSDKLAYQSTGLRIDAPLVAIDVDIDDAEVVEELWRWAEKAWGCDWAERAMIRYGGGVKECWVCRVDEPFRVPPGPKYVRPEHDPKDKDATTHKVELFGGVSGRQIGAYGWHTTSVRRYEWADGKGPAEVLLSALPVITKQQVFSIDIAYSDMLEARGWHRVLRYKPEDWANVEKVYDLPAGLMVKTHQRGDLPVEELHDGDRVRMAEIAGTGTNTTRGLAHQTHEGVAIWDSETGTTHYLESAAPKEMYEQHEELGAKLLAVLGRERFEELVSNVSSNNPIDAGGRVGRKARLTITIYAGETETAVKQTLAYLRDDPEVFDCGDMLTTIKDGRRMPLNTDALVGHTLGEKLAFAKFRILQNGAEKVNYVDPPPMVCKTIRDLKTNRQLKPLVAVTDVPFLRPDGTVVSEPGYDAETGIFYLPIGQVVEVPEQPTMAEVKAALATVMFAFSEFPFVTAADWGALLAGIGTACIRASLPTAPAFGISAPTKGSGKTKVALCLATLTGPQTPSILPPSVLRNEDELKKTIFATLLRGSTAMPIDNVMGIVNSGTLAALLTSDSYTDRLLGSSETISMPNRLLTILTGNNLHFQEDMVRRVVIARMDPRTERPWERTFEFDPVLHVKEHRVAIVAGFLTLIRGRLTMAEAHYKPAIGSFEQWSVLVRDTVCWIGQVVDDRFGDPMDTVKQSFEDDPAREVLADLLRQLRAIFGSARFSSEDIRRVLACNGINVSMRGRGDEKTTAVDLKAAEAARDAWGELIGLEALQNSRRIGKQLRFRVDQIAGGLALQREYDTHKEAWQWYVEERG